MTLPQTTFYHQLEAQHLPFPGGKMGREADYPISFRCALTGWIVTTALCQVAVDCERNEHATL